MSGLLDEIRAGRSLPPPEIAREIRVNAGVSQARLAREIGVHRLTVARWERGTRMPRSPHRATYAALLDKLRAVCES